jgi:ribonucleotide reductase alpha subunit
MWNAVPEGKWDWDSLRKDIAKWGIRNSLLLAPMPTASTSQILGFNECFEPFTNNIYQRQTLAGEFTLINKYLIKDLLDIGLWNLEMKNKILMASGSIQDIQEIPEDIRALYKTVWELKQKVLIDQSADRGIYVCQSQSLNLFVEEPDLNKLTMMHFYAWNKGLKTGIYYLRTRPKAKVSAFTLDTSSAGNTSNTSNSTMNTVNSSPMFACTRENKDCLMCSS